MRRISLIVLAALLAVPAIARAQAQDPVVVSARQFAQQGNHDTAIALLRSALASRPSDPALKAALVDVLKLKMVELNRQMLELRQAINDLGGGAPTLPRDVSCAAGAPVRLGGAIAAPSKVKHVDAIYPSIAQSAKVEGIVIVEALIDCNGSVADVKILRGQPLLNEAALEAVRQWQYTPVLLNGVPVKVLLTATVAFRLE
jgi:TonB family protein